MALLARDGAQRQSGEPSDSAFWLSIEKSKSSLAIENSHDRRHLPIIPRCSSAWQRLGGGSAAVYLLRLFWSQPWINSVLKPDCPVCSAWSDKEKDRRRSELERAPLHDPICKACSVAFWGNTSGPRYTEDDFEEAICREKQVKGASVELRPRSKH
jgi:hypothetical protein